MYVNSYSQQPVVKDSGTAAGGGPGIGLTELGLTEAGAGSAPYANAGTGPYGTNNCDYDAPTTNSTGYHYLCFGPNAQGGGLIAYGAVGAATQLPLQFIVNGVLVPLNGGGSTPTFRRVITGNADNATTADGPIATIAWASADAAPKSEVLPACTSSNVGVTITIKDEQGTANTYPITVTASGSTLDGQLSDVLSSNLQAQIFQCDGNGNWILE